MKNILYAMNSFFLRNGRENRYGCFDEITKNEIDYLLSTKKYIIKDVTVLDNLNKSKDEITDTFTKQNFSIAIAKRIKKEKLHFRRNLKTYVRRIHRKRKKSLKYVKIYKDNLEKYKRNQKKIQEIEIGILGNNRGTKCLRPRLGRDEMKKIKHMNEVETKIKYDITNINLLIDTELYPITTEPLKEIVYNLK